MVATVFTENEHPFAFVVSETGNGKLSRDTITVGQSQTIQPGQVLGRTTTVSGATSSAAADAGNTGNGTLTLDPSTPVLSNAVDGNYRVVAATAGASAAFEVFAPNGVEIGRYTLGGSAFATQVKFSMAAGGAAFAVGDAFSISVGVEYDADETYAALNMSATDGTQNAFAIAGYPAVTGSGASAQIAAIVRHAEVRATDLQWPSGITAVQKAEAIDQLRARGIILR